MNAFEEDDKTIAGIFTVIVTNIVLNTGTELDAYTAHLGVEETR